MACGCRQARQSSKLLTLSPHLSLEGGESAGGVGVDRLDAPAGLLQVPAQGTGLLLNVEPEAEARCTLGLELGSSLRDEVVESRLCVTLEGLHRGLKSDNAAGHVVQPLAQGADLILTTLWGRVRRHGRCGCCSCGRCNARRSAGDATRDAGTACRRG